MKKTLSILTALVFLTGCSSGNDSGPAAQQADAERYTVNGFEVTVTPAEPIDFSGYGDDLVALYRDIPDSLYGCEPVAVDRNIDNALYVSEDECPEGRETYGYDAVTVLIYSDAQAAKDDLAFDVENQSMSNPHYRSGRYVVWANEEADLNTVLTEFSKD